VHKYIMAFSKGSMRRTVENRRNAISRDEFLEYAKNAWSFPTQSARAGGHPAPFPVELPYRLMQLYSFEGDVVLDPFCGSGTTCIAAIKANRHYIGFDNNEEYVGLSRSRISEYLSSA